MGRNIYLIHGAYGNSKENWFPWLQVELTSRGFAVFAPDFPTPQEQTLENWLTVFRRYERYIDEETVFIGHSLGVAFILSILENVRIPVRGCFLVAGFVGLLGNGGLDDINGSFVSKEFDWGKIRKNCGSFRIYHSDDDPYVSSEKAQELAANLEVRAKIVEGAGHFNRAAGYVRFDLVLEDILGLYDGKHG